MAPTHLVNVDDQGNIISPEVNARLEEKFGGGTGGAGGITAATTLDQAAQNGA
jgi:hypothetical protein